MTNRHREARARFRIPSLHDIFASPLANAYRRVARWRRHGWLGAAMREQRQRSMRFETLEPRLLLSADLTHTVAAGAALDATLKIDDVDGSQIVRLVDNPSGTVLGEANLDQDIDVTVHGAELSDRLDLRFDAASLAHAMHIAFDGGAGGEDELAGPDRSATWKLSAPGAGSVDSDISFSDVEKLTGGSGDDTFVVLDPSSTTALDGGGGTNTLVAADATNAWTISGTDSGTLNGQAFARVQNVQGGSADDTFTIAAGGQLGGAISGGAGNDTLVAADQNNAWTVDGANAGTLNGAAFTDVENLSGGAADDTFTFSAAGSLTGGLSGGAGNDTLVAADGDNVWLISGDNAGALNGQSFAGIENLSGGAGNDTFIFAGGSISGTIDGGAGNNTFDYSSRASAVTIDLGAATASGAGAMANIGNFVGGSGSDTLLAGNADNSWTVSAPDAGSVGATTFQSVENLSGGSGSDRFVFTAAGTLSGTIAGGAGDDSISGANRANAWTVTGTDAGTLNDIAYAGIENLIGGMDSDVFMLMAAGGLSGTIAGGEGVDRVRGPERRTVWRLSGQGSGDVGGTRFSGVEDLEGAADNEDTFIVESGGGLSGTVDGGPGGFDTLVTEGSYDTVVFTAWGPSSGTVALDANVITYDGLEPIANTGVAPNIVFNLPGSGNQAVLEDDGTAGNGISQLRSTNASFELTTFSASGTGGSVTINLGNGADTLTINALDSTFNRALTIVGGSGADQITVNAKTGSQTYSLNGGANGDTYVVNIAGPGSGTIDIADSGASGSDTLTVSGTASADSITISSTAVTLGSESVHYSGVETVSVNAGADDDTITVTSLSSDVTTYNVNGGAGSNDSLTVNGTAGADAITISSTAIGVGTGSVHYSNFDDVTVAAGLQDDTITVNSLGSTVAYTIDGGAGTDTLDLGGVGASVTLAASALTGTGVNVTLQNIEKIDNANLQIAADKLAALLQDLETLSKWVRQAIAIGDFASQLPLLFAGDQTTVDLNSAVRFADAIDAVRADLHSYYNTLSSGFSLNDLETRLQGIADHVKHYAGAVVADFAPTVVNTDTANFSVSFDGGAPVAVAVTFTHAGTLDGVIGDINAAISGVASLSGRITADKTDDGRLMFRVLDSGVVSYAITTPSAANNAYAKLGLALNSSKNAIEAGIGELTGAANKLLGAATTFVTIDQLTGTQKLNLHLPFDLHRSSEFGVDLGKDIRDLKGISFDASAKLVVTTDIHADVDLGLTLDVSPTFSVTLNDLSASIEINSGGGDNFSGDLSVGFLGVHAGGQIDLSAALALDAPVTKTLSQLAAGNTTGVSFTPTGSLSARFDLSVLDGLKDGSNDFDPSGVYIELPSADPFDPTSFEFSDFVQHGDFSDLFSFSNLTPQGMITLLKKIASSLDDVANSDLFKSFKIPFVSGTLSDAIDMVKSFQRAILFDDGGDGTDTGTSLVTDLNAALVKAGLGNRFVVQGDGTHVKLVATDDSITTFSVSGLPAVGLNGSSSTSGLIRSLSGTPVGFGVLGSDGTLTININSGAEIVHVDVTKNATADNTGVGNDVAKLLNANGSPTFHTAQEFASHLVTLLNLDRSVIVPNFDHLTDELTFRLQLDAGLPAVQFPLNFNLPLGPFGGFSSSGTLSITPDAGIDLTFGVDLGAGGALADGTALGDLIQPLTISSNPALTGGDLNAFAIAGRLSADALFSITVNGVDYMVALTASATSTNRTASDLATDLNNALQSHAQRVSDSTAVDLTTYLTAGLDSSGKRLQLTVNHTTVTSLHFNPPASSIVSRELGFQGETSITAAPASNAFITAAKDVPLILGRVEAASLPVDATFTVTMNGASGVLVTVPGTASSGNKTVLDLVSDVTNALIAAHLDDDLTVDAQGTALFFKSKDSTTFTIAGGSHADQLGLGVSNSSNHLDAVITLSNGTKKNVSFTKDDGTPALTIGDIKHAIVRDTSSLVTVAFNADGTALVLTDTTFIPFVGTATNPNPALFRVEATNGSGAASRLGILAADAVGSTDKPDGKIAGAAIAGIPLLDRLFIKTPANGDPEMLHASLSISTGAGITGTANFGFVGLNFTGTGAIDVSVGASLKDPGTSPATSGKITLAEIIGALTTDPTELLEAPTVTVDPDDLGHDTMTLALTASTGVGGFSVGGSVGFQVVDFGDPFHGVAPHIELSHTSGLNNLFDNFSNLSFEQIIAMLAHIVSNLDAFEGSGSIGSFKIPLVNLSIHDLLSNVDKFTAALDSLQSNPAGSLQVLAQKLSEALGVPTTLSLDTNRYLRFQFNFSDSVSKGINLQIPADLLAGLPAGFKLTGSAGLDFAGNLALTLDFGLDLQALTSDPSTVLDDIYIYHDTGFTGTATFSGDNINLLAAIGPIAASIEDGEASISASFGLGLDITSGKVALSDLFDHLDTPDLHGEVSANLPFSFNGLSIGSIQIADFQDKDHDSNTTEAASLATFGFDDLHADLELPNLSDFSLFDSLLLSAQGLDSFLSGLQDLLSGQVFGGTKIPLIGDQLAQGAQFIEKLRRDFVAPYRQAIEAAKNAADHFADPASNVISGILFDLLGPGTVTKPGLNLLEKLDGHSGSAQQDYVKLLTNLDKYLQHQVDPDLGHVPDTTETAIEWDFTLGGEYNLGPNISFDLGLPGLGLSMDGTLDVNVHWELHVGFGFNFTDGFFVVLGDPDHPDAPDVDVGLTVSLSDHATLTGELGFLQLTATNDYALRPANDVDYGFHGTGVTADFGVNLKNGNDEDNPRIGFTDLGNLGVEATITAAAAVEVDLSLGLNPGVVGASVASGMPKVLANFVLDWALDDNPVLSGLQPVALQDVGDAMQTGLRLVEFDDIQLDVGGFVSDVLGPIVKKVKEVTEPLQPIIDVITSPIPVISDLAGSPVTLLDIAASFGHVDAGLIYGIADIIELVNSIPDPGDADLMIPLLNGPLTIYDASDLVDFGDVHLWDKNFKLGSKADDLVGKVQDQIGNLKDKIQNADASGSAANAAAKQAVTSMFGGKGSHNGEGGFSFPLFDHPEQIFNLLLGKSTDLALVEYRLPTLDFSFEYSQFFPIFGPLGVSIFGTVGLTIDLGFGYDTRGIREFIDSKATHPELLVDGFYLTDLDSSGNDIPELTFTGGIGAAAELNLGIAEAGVAGGIGLEVDFNLHDNDHDGKVRLNEMIGNIFDEAVIGNDPVFAPLAVFDIHGDVFAQLSAFLKIDLFFWSFEHTWNITPKITLVSFDVPFVRAPKLGTLSDSGELRLNMGPYADQRLNGALTDGDENFTVTHGSGSAGNETLIVTSTLGGGTQTYTGVKKLIIDGGEGVDHITLSGVQSDMVITGGAGNDVIDLTGSTGRATIHGDAGDDDITGGSGDDVIYGGLGKDTIHGGPGRDIIFGDGETLGDTFADASIAGNDSDDHIYGGAGDDILFGAGGSDYIEGGGGSDIIIGDAGTVALTNGFGTWSVDWAKGVTDTMTAKKGGNDEIHGGDGDDYIFGGAGDDKLYGDADNDRIFGEAGSDTMEGGSGNNIVFGDGWTLVGSAKLNDPYPATGLQPSSGGDKDVITGGSGTDFIYGGGGNDVLDGGGGNDTIYGGTGADTIHGGDGDDTIYGQSENDTIYGDGGSDLLSGDAGNDKVFGGDGTGLLSDGGDSIYAGFGSDQLDGEGGGDQYYIFTRGGNAAEFTTVYDSGGPADNDFMTINGTSEDDVFLLRAMADAYIPTLDRLHTLIEKVYNLGVTNGDDSATIRASLEDAITRVYTPNVLPSGMLDDLLGYYDNHPGDLAGLKTSVDATFVPAAHRTAFVAKLNSGGASIERFNYRNIEGITLNTLYGNDYVASDDTLAVFTINGGVGNDRFQIGQVFKSQRDTTADTANVLPEDVFATLEITRGWLSNGISASMTINGGDGNDDFTVFHNKQSLTLDGGDGDDTFTVRAFALVGSVDDQRARTDMKGDAGADTIKYAVNAPVGIDGGDGFDTVIVVGTEFSDDFVVTDAGVFGAGLNVSYVNIEKLKVDGAEGDDRYFVLSTDANVVTEIDGGLGSDTFFTGGAPADSPIYVTSNDLRGYNGIILNSIEASGSTTGYEGVKVEGIAANVADDDEPFIVINESGGFSTVTEDLTAATAGIPTAEGWDYDTYTVTLTHPLQAGETVQVHVLPQEPSPEDEAQGFKTLEFWNGSGYVSDITLTFSSAGTQTVQFRAAHDDAAEGKRFGIINHKITSLLADGTTPGQYDGLAVRSVKVQINDDDKAGAIITRTNRPLQVIEGNASFDQTYAVVLTRAPTANVVVTLDPFFDQVTLSGATLSGNQLTFTSSNYNHAQFVTVTPVDDSVKQGLHTDYISHTLASTDHDTTQTRSRYQLDGDPAVVGVNNIPVEKPLDTMLLQDRPTGNVTVWVDNVVRDSGRYLITGNTLLFLGPDGSSPESITGKVEIQYDYVKAGYNNAAANRQVVDINDNEVATVVVIETDGSTDVIEGGATDTVQFVLTKQPTADVTLRLDSFNTRTGGLDPDTLENFAFFEQHVRIDGVLTKTLTFSSNSAAANAWNKAQTVTISAINDSKVDGDEIQAFVPSVPTLNKIRGPLFIEGASGSGSLSLPAPLLLPLPQQERNVHPSTGQVVSFTAGSPGPGAIDFVTVNTANLLSVVSSLNDLVGRTFELTKGPGTGIVLDPATPRNLYDRFWLINAVRDNGDGTTRLTLQNPSQVDTSKPAVTAPTSASSYAITSLSINFFADERQQVDTMFLYDQGSVADKTGRLTASNGMVQSLVGNQMTVATADLEAAAQALAGGINDLLHHTLTISVGGGLGRSWTIDAISDGTSSDKKVLTLVSPTGSGTVDSLSEFRIDGSVVKGRVSGFGMGPNATLNGFAEPGGIRYGDLEVVQANLGTGDDHVTVDYTTASKDHSTKRDAPFYTLTMLNTGLGNDTVTVNLADGQNGALSLNTQEGNDIVHGEGSSLPLVVFGWDGNDKIYGGSGADILFGDQGRVDYVNDSGFVVTRLGHTWEQPKVNPPITSANATQITDSTASFPTDYGGLVGLSVQAISPAGLVQFRTITANTGTTITVDHAWDVTPDSTYFYRVSMLPEDQTDGKFRGPRVTWSINDNTGGNDQIFGGDGADVIIGGAGQDTVQGNVGNDIIAGDGGRLDYSPISGVDGLTKLDLVQTTRDAYGDVDNLSGNAGVDIIMGGAAGDTIYGDNASASAGAADGADYLIGDNGQVEYAGGVITRVRTQDIAEPTGGADTISGNAGSDYILGGVAGDTIYGDAAAPGANDGADAIIGDHGTFDFNFSEGASGVDGNLATLDLVQTRIDTLGGADTISGNAGTDLILGGTAGDTLYGNNAAATADASDGADYLIGDNGRIYLINGTVSYLATTDAVEAAGADTISGNAKGDFILGGVGGDTIYGDAAAPGTYDGNDAIVGDHGRIDFSSGDGERSTLDLVTTFADSLGGADTISGNAGADMVLAGSAGDTLYGNNAAATSDATDGADYLIGDNGSIVLVANKVAYMATDATGAIGGSDTISGNAKGDYVLGGVGGDTIYGDALAAGTNDGNDTILGDQGRLDFNLAAPYDGDPNTRDLLQTTDTGLGGADTIYGNAGDDVIVGGALGDTVHGNAGNDLVFGDFGSVKFGSVSVTKLAVTAAYSGYPVYATTTDLNLGGADTLYGDADEDVLAGGAFSDRVDGGSQDDLIFGDNVTLNRDGSLDGVVLRNDFTNPRFRTASGRMYDANGELSIDGVAQNFPSSLGTPVWANWEITLDQSLDASHYGNDYIAGGAQDDQIFGQLGDDTIQGDSTIDLAVDAGRTQASIEGAADGDDYIEGNGGTDVIFGDLGQDDIIGGNSNQFSLGMPSVRPDTSDLIFGGAGTEISRLNAGAPTDGTSAANVHARDSDMIIADNGNIFRIVTSGGASANSTDRGFNYDSYGGTLKIIPRAAQLLDYTPGGPDYTAAAEPDDVAVNPVTLVRDIGGNDEVHGESGDDFIYGQLGADVIFGDGQDDDIIGGYGNDWISGGNGDDGVIGDDGRIYTSRNTFLEPLNGITTATAQLAISTPGGMQSAIANPNGDLKKAVDITPFSQDAIWNGNGDEFAGVAGRSHRSDDIIYGGLGSDWLHGGTGDDAISGAEALAESYFSIVDASGAPIGVAESDFFHPYNPGNVLHYNSATGTFVYYDEFNPMRKILLTNDGKLSDTGTGKDFILNFNLEGPNDKWSTGTSYTPVATDGDDKIFGDNANDWLVGGTGRDDIYGGWGDDLVNADDNLETDGRLNDQPDTHPSYEDRAYGGAGRDVLIANTGGDRLIDWVGEFNSYLVPFAPFGLGTVSRTLQPQLAEFLYALSASDGADFSRAADTGADPVRNGEPVGELGVVRQQDFSWQDQTGGPRDVQAGNIPGGKRDVLRSASFDGSQAVQTTAGGFVSDSGFSPDSGKWSVQNGALQVSADSPSGDAVSVFQIGDALPGYFEVQASVLAIKPTGGWNANSYLIFDYQSKTDFKFAGIDVSTNKLVMGHRNASGWFVDEQAAVTGGLKSDTSYNLLLSVNGLNATLIVNNQMAFTHTFQARVVDGYSYGLSWGLVGVGSNNARGSFDNVQVQVLPPQITFDQTEDFSDGVANLFTGYMNGAWSVGSGRYSATPGTTAGMSVLDIGPDNLQVASYLELSAKVNTAGQAGFVFDRYSDGTFKFAMIDVVTGQVKIGHYTAKNGWVTDAAVSRPILAGDNILSVALKGSTVSVSLNNQVVLGFAFNAVTVDGRFGLLARNAASFDDVRVKTDDAAFRTAGGGAQLASTMGATQSASTLTQSQLDAIASVAISDWTQALGDGDARLAAFGDVRIGIADLADGELGYTSGNSVLIDDNAAGAGWYTGLSAEHNSYMDLVSVVEHELGHVLGFSHEDASLYPVMSEDLDIGERLDLLAPSKDAGPAAPHASAPAAPAFDTLGQRLAGMPSATIDWQALATGGWNVALSPYAAPPAPTSQGNFSSFAWSATGGQTLDGSGDGGYDRMGRDLVGKKPGKSK